MTFATGSNGAVSHRFSQPRIAVIGAGVIGLACALELGRRGAIVCVYEKGEAAGAGTSSRAAGMLGLAYEAPEYASQAHADLAKRSMQLWPDFAAGLHDLTGGGCSFRADGTLACATDEAEAGKLDAVASACLQLGLPCEEVGDRVKTLEPALQGEMRRVLRLKTDMQVDAGLLVTRLARGLEAVAARCVTGLDIVRIDRRKRRFVTPDGEEWDQVLLALGAADQAPAFFDEAGAPLEPSIPAMSRVKGQILALEPQVGAPRHVVRVGPLYVVPKHAATLIGGTSQTDASDLEVDREMLDGLRERATRLLPGLALAREIGAWAGFRPRTDDDAPVMGETAVDGVFVAGGHYRNGVLLAPATAEWIAHRILDGRAPFGLDDFSPGRFTPRVEPSHSP